MRFDPYELTRFLRESGLTLKQTSRSWVLECPRCNRPKLNLLKSSGRFVCWYCGERNFYGSAEFALAEILQKPVEDVRAGLLNNEFTTQLSVNLRGEEAPEEEFVEETYLWPHNFYELSDPKAKPGIIYLESRGIPYPVAQKYQIRYCTSHRTVVFPILDGSSLLGWQERITYPDTFYVKGRKVTVPKAITAEGCEKANLLMFSNNLIGSDHCVLTEGPVTAIKADLCGGAVATMGKSISRNQLELLTNWAYSSKTRKRLYLALDPDAYIQTNQLVRDYYPYFDLYDMVPTKGDLGDLTFEENLELFRSAKKIGPSHLFVYLKGWKV